MTDGDIRVVLADDHTVVRTGLKAVLGAARDIHVIGEAQNGREAVAMTAAEHPDVVVLDLSMPDLNGLQAATLIHNQFPETQLILLTMHDSLELKDQLTASGIRACIRKDDLNQLVIAIRNACQLEPKLS